jgi:hypothetical protein
MRARRIGGGFWHAALGALLAGVLAAAPLALADTGGASRVPLPAVTPANPGKCVAATPYILRNHPDLLKHHRDETVHEGIRTTRYSLVNCVNCHASKETGRVTGSRDAFCEGCHRYAAVSLDCFDCHSDRREVAVGAAGAAPAAETRQ